MFNIFLADIPEILNNVHGAPVAVSHDLNTNCLIYGNDIVIMSRSYKGLPSYSNELNNIAMAET